MRHILGIVCLGAMLGAAACGAADEDARVTEQAFSYRDGVLGVVASMRTPETVDDVEVRIALYRNGEVVDTQRSSLPFCVRRTECWWAESYTTAPDDVDQVEVTVAGGTPTGGTRRIVRVAGNGRAQQHGLLYRILQRGDRPVWGTSVSVRPGDVIDTGYLYVGARGERGEPGAD